MTSSQLTDLALIAADSCSAVIVVISAGSSAAQIRLGRETANAPDKLDRRNARRFIVFSSQCPLAEKAEMPLSVLKIIHELDTKSKLDTE